MNSRISQLGYSSRSPSQGITRRNSLVGAAATGLSVWQERGLAETSGPFPHVIVLVPGILGSELQRGGKLIWGVGINPLISIAQAGSLDMQELRLGPPTDPPVVATSLFPTTTIVPGFWKVDGYTEVRRALLGQLELSERKNYFEFAYDWRLDNRVAARQLVARGREWLGAWRESTKNKDAKLVIVAHSMGGLVARYACEVLGLRKDVQAVFTMGTPYQGSYKCLERLVNGFVTAGLTQTLKSFDSTYQLLPTYPCIEVDGGAARTVAQERAVLQDHIDMHRVQQVGASFHVECSSAAEANKSDPVSMSWLVTQASTHVTPSFGKFHDGRLSVWMRDKNRPTGGDGTVPGYRLGQPVANSVAFGAMHCNQIHGSMQNDATVIRNIVDTIKTGIQAGSKSGDPLSFSVPDVVRVNEPFQIRLNTERPADMPTSCRIENVATNELVSNAAFQLKPGEQDVESSISMPNPGVFRFVVQSGGRSICSDLIAVVSARA